MPEKEPRRRVLLVDDDKVFLALMRCLLSPRYDVLCLSDAGSLPEDLDAFRPDLVILDVRMPGSDGFSLCRKIRAHPSHGEVPVLFLTASLADPDFLEHLASRGNGYLAKPVEDKELIAAVEDLIARWPVRSMVRP